MDTTQSEQISKSSDKTSNNIENMGTRLCEKIDNATAEIIKWMFIFWISNVITIIGGIVGILKIAKVF